jgi:hypothetical protein
MHYTLDEQIAFLMQKFGITRDYAKRLAFIHGPMEKES